MLNQINYLSVLIGSFIIFNSVNVISVTAQTEAEYNINEENIFDTTDYEEFLTNNPDISIYG